MTTFHHFNQLHLTLLTSLKAVLLLLIQFSWCVREFVANCSNGISLHMVAVWKISPHRNNTCSIRFLFDKPQCKEVAFFCCCFGVGVFVFMPTDE